MSAVLHRPTNLAQALGLLAADADARPVAGGASLVAMMNAGLVAPTALVSLKGIAELRGTAILPDGRIRIGAMTRHCETAGNAALSGTTEVVRRAAGSIANPPVRNMGTMGGSISLADPGADYPAALAAVGADVELASAGGRRIVPARAFFIDWYTTALEPGELVTAIILPAPRPGRGLYRKLARVAGDYATVSIAMAVAGDGAVAAAVGACGPAPVRSDEVDALLSGSLADPAAVRRAGELLAALADPVDDVRASADYRRLVIPRMLESVAAEAVGAKAAA